MVVKLRTLIACIKSVLYKKLSLDMSVGRAAQTVDAGGKDGAQESGYCADVVGGWVEGGRRVKAIVLARIKVVKNFSKSSKSCSGLAAQWLAH